MKKMALIILTVLLSHTTVASENEGLWFINPTVGYHYLDGDRDLDADALIGLGVEYQYNQSWGTEIKYLQSSMNSDTGGANDADMRHLLLEGLYYIKPNAKEQFSPYLAAGLGHEEYDYDISGKDDGTTALFGPGFRYRFNDRWSSKVDLRWVHGIDDSENDGLFSVAVSYALGRIKTKAAVEPIVYNDTDKDGVNDNNDQCPSSLPGVEVDASGCELDSDGDSVLNSMDKCQSTAVGAKVDNNGCAEKLSRTETIALNVTFATGSDTLTNNFMEEVEKVVRFMREYASVTGVIEGYTDSKGSVAFNKKLSQRRAESVRRVLVNQFGIEPQRLSAMGYGEEGPIASNDTPEGRQENRRVAAFFEAQITQ